MTVAFLVMWPGTIMWNEVYDCFPYIWIELWHLYDIAGLPSKHRSRSSMFGFEIKLGREQKERDLWHLHQAEDDRNRRLLCPLFVLPLPQAQVLGSINEEAFNKKFKILIIWNFEKIKSEKLTRVRVFMKRLCLSRNGTHACLGGRCDMVNYNYQCTMAGEVEKWGRK